MNRKVLILTILSFAFVLTTAIAFAALTLDSTTVSSNGALTLTGTANSTWDLGTGHDLFLQTSGGKVGIGATPPTSTLSVQSTGSTHPFTATTPAGYVDINQDGSLSLNSTNGGGGALSIFTLPGSKGVVSSFNGPLYFQSFSSQPVFLETKLLVGNNIGTPASNLVVYGNTAIGAGYSATVAPTNGMIVEGNVGIGTASPNANAILDLTSTTKAFLLPRMTKAQRDAIATPVAGMAVYQTDNTPGLRVYNGTNWMRYTETSD